MSVWSDLSKQLVLDEVDPHFSFTDGLCESFSNKFPIARGHDGELERVAAVELVLAGTLSMPIMQFAGISSGKVVAGGNSLYRASAVWLSLNPEHAEIDCHFAPLPWWAVFVDSTCKIYRDQQQLKGSLEPHSVYRQVFAINKLPWNVQGARIYLDLVHEITGEDELLTIHPIMRVHGDVERLILFLNARFVISLSDTDVAGLRELYLTQLNPINAHMRNYYRNSVLIGENMLRVEVARTCLRESPQKYQDVLNRCSNDSLHKVLVLSEMRDLLPTTDKKWSLALAFHATVGSLPLELAQRVLYFGMELLS